MSAEVGGSDPTAEHDSDMRLLVLTSEPTSASPRRITDGFILRTARLQPALAADSSLPVPDSSLCGLSTLPALDCSLCSTRRALKSEENPRGWCRSVTSHEDSQPVPVRREQHNPAQTMKTTHGQIATRFAPPIPLLVACFLAALATHSSHAAVLSASDGAAGDRFGSSVNLSGNMALVGAPFAKNGTENDLLRDGGSAYVFRGLDTATGSITQNAKITGPDEVVPSGGGIGGDRFGSSVSLSGNIGYVTDMTFTRVDPGNTNSFIGQAYFYSGLDTATGSITQTGDGGGQGIEEGDLFGSSVSISGGIGLIGAAQLNGNSDTPGIYGPGYARVQRGLGGTNVFSTLTLRPSGGRPRDAFGASVSVSGNIGLVGAPERDRFSVDQGAAYVFRNLDTAALTINENVTLTAFDNPGSDWFGNSVSLSGSIGLVGAFRNNIGTNAEQGSAYVFRGLNTATGTITQNVRLTASDGAAGDRFGVSVSLSGSTGLVGADGNGVSGRGSAYLFRNLDTATGTIIQNVSTITQNVKLTASDGAGGGFGASVSLDGDQFLIGAPGKNSDRGLAYGGSVSSFTTLDTGSTSKTIEGLSFTSQDDWIIGQTTDANQVTLSVGDTANVTAAGKAVYIGKDAGSDNNTLTINGILAANAIHVGATGNTGNKLVVNGSIGGSTVTLNSGGILSGAGTVGSLTVGDGASLSPGNSPGTLNVAGNVTWLGGGNYNWQTLNTVGTTGTQWDLISATGALDLTALSIGSKFNINVWSLQSTGPDVNGDIANFDNTQTHQWLIAIAAGGITGFTGTEQFNINVGATNGTAGFSNLLDGGTFSVSQSGNELFLSYSAVPEPRTWALVAPFLAGAVVAHRRRSARRQST
jgi:hypothetical protein